MLNINSQRVVTIAEAIVNSNHPVGKALSALVSHVIPKRVGDAGCVPSGRAVCGHTCVFSAPCDIFAYKTIQHYEYTTGAYTCQYQANCEECSC